MTPFTRFAPLSRLVLTGVLWAVVPPVSHAQMITESQYRGWKSVRLANELIELQVVPEIGGRVMALRLGDFDFVFLNEDLAGRTSGPTGVGPNGEWFNYGGEKLWPAPQGKDGRPGHWNGPPDAVLDGRPHRASIQGARGSETLRLVSRDDPRSGLRLSRELSLDPAAAHVRVTATMTNVGSGPCRWGIWSVLQQNAANRSGEGFDPNVRIYCPLNPRSVHPAGYRVLYGPPDSSSFQVDPSGRRLIAKYERKMGKVAIDGSAGWVATVHGSSGHVLVQRYAFRPEQEYPDQAAVEIWLHGPYGPKAAQTDARTFPYFVETELLSPFAALAPGESSMFSYDWYATNIGGAFPVVDCNDAGVVSEPLAIVTREGRRMLTGRFGVYVRGTVMLVAEDIMGQPVAAPLLRQEVSPGRPVLLAQELPSLPERTDSLALVVADAAGQPVGRLALALVPTATP